MNNWYRGVMIPLIKPMTREELERFNNEHYGSRGINYEGTLLYELAFMDCFMGKEHELIFEEVPTASYLEELKEEIPVDCDFDKALCFECFHYDTVDNPLDECTLEEFLEAQKEATNKHSSPSSSDDDGDEDENNYDELVDEDYDEEDQEI